MGKIRITLVKSGISFDQTQRRTLKALGFHRLHESVTQEDSTSLRGMIQKVRHLVNEEEVDNEAG